jgi:uncharacterized protein (DUF1810 family)
MKAHNLERFITAQKSAYQTALTELKAGKKQSHWMWYIFPQIQGLGYTEISRKYGIEDLDEATEYLRHRILGPRLILLSHILLGLENGDAHKIFGSPDDLKLKSCMTLFSQTQYADPVFELVLEKFFNGLKDHITLRILNMHRQG